MSATSGKWGRQGPRYRRRRPLPALIVLGTLVLVSGFVWSNTFETSEDIETATRCNQPSPPTSSAPASDDSSQPDPSSLGKMLPRDALDQTTPASPRAVSVRVLNGNGESMQAAMIADELTSLGFTQDGEPSNDPSYPNYDLNCHGQIRFGSAGAPQARTLSMVVPCAQLVRDDRQDPSVDLALGAEFDDIQTTNEAKQVLQELKTWTPNEGQHGDAQQQVSSPKLNEDLLTQARDVYC